MTDKKKQTLALLAVDNIYPSKAGLELFAAIDRGEMTVEEAKAAIIERAKKYGAASQQKRDEELP